MSHITKGGDIARSIILTIGDDGSRQYRSDADFFCLKNKGFIFLVFILVLPNICNGKTKGLAIQYIFHDCFENSREICIQYIFHDCPLLMKKKK